MNLKNIKITINCLLPAVITAYFLFFIALSTFAQEVTTTETSSDNLLPTFKYHRYNIEPYTKTYIDLLLPLDTKIVKVEVVNAEEIGSGFDNEALRTRGLKIIKHNRKRVTGNKISELREATTSTNSAVFNLQKLNNLNYIIEASNHKIFKIALKGLPSSLYTLQATVDDKLTTSTKILTNSDFRIDDISPSLIDVGTENIVTIEGKNLNALTKVLISGDNIEIREIESLSEDILKIKVFVQENAEYGFRDITASNDLLGKSSTLIGGLYIGPRIGEDGLDGSDGEDGIDGAPGEDGIDGMSICNNPEHTLTIFANNLSPGSQATSFFDPVLCNLTFGIPVGYNGVNGSVGSTGQQGGKGDTGTTGVQGGSGTSGLTSLIKTANEASGTNCSKGGVKIQTGLDSNSNNTLDDNEISTTNYVCNGKKDGD